MKKLTGWKDKEHKAWLRHAKRIPDATFGELAHASGAHKAGYRAAIAAEKAGTKRRTKA